MSPTSRTADQSEIALPVQLWDQPSFEPIYSLMGQRDMAGMMDDVEIEEIC